MILLKKAEKEISLQHSNQVYPIERIVAAASYLTTGFAGVVWMIIAAIFRKHLTQFLLYHIMQSIFLSIAYFLLTVFARFIFIILYKIPLINAIPYYINMPIPFLSGLSVIQGVTAVVLLYLVITSFLGFYSYIPWVSDIINTNTGRK